MSASVHSCLKMCYQADNNQAYTACAYSLSVLEHKYKVQRFVSSDFWHMHITIAFPMHITNQLTHVQKYLQLFVHFDYKSIN